MKPRDILIIILALCVSISVAFATRYILRGDSRSSSNLTKVLVASGDLAVGRRIDKGSYRWQEWPTETVQPIYITENEKKTADGLPGSMVKQHINSGEPIVKTSLVGERGYLSAMIADNRRAFTIPLDNKSNISGKVLPEDYVDVIMARREKDTYVASTVVRKVKVLEINGTLDPNEAEDAAKKNAQSITIEVTPEQAEFLAAALREGSPVISLHSMNSNDSGAPEKVEKVKPKDNVLTVIRGRDSQKLQMKG
jgi:pilus assembly protein CpaB